MSILLALNAGSSSLKFAAFSREKPELSLLASGQVDGLGGDATFTVKLPAGPETTEALDPVTAPHGHGLASKKILAWLSEFQPGAAVLAVSHRVVHGGPDLLEPVVLDGATLTRLQQLIPLAPLHQPHNLAGIHAAREAFPHATQVACFDTSFHRSHPFVADTFALPRSYYNEGVRRYGFHGLSYEFISRRLKTMYPDLHAGRVIVAHLGNGASMCAMLGGRSVASTMGFTALDGLPMGTRCGQIDPGVVLYLLAEKGMSIDAVTDLLYKNSGLKGLSGLSNDVRELEAADSPASRDALSYFVDQCRREIGGLAASIGGLDALVFTGGIGENAVQVRSDMLHDMGWIGIHLDEKSNRAGGPVISHPESPVTVLVLCTDEGRMLAEHAVEVMGLPSTAGAPDAISSTSTVQRKP
ncbi:MAG: acetate/propionate family kinase [Burkholderiaceae bacterium]|nr:acetate/propionate family kinase [Burkholderiaceae bacterium]